MSESDSSQPNEEMREYLQTFLDESEEQLEDLVDSVLALETDPTNQQELDEAFRLIHSIKGSAGMMGFDNITVLTHHLETRFEHCRSGLEHLDAPTMSVVLRCIDFLKDCIARLRAEQNLGSPASLLEELKQLETARESASAGTEVDLEPESTKDAGADSSGKQSFEFDQQANDDQLLTVSVVFRDDLALADLKAQLIATRLSDLGEIQATSPPIDTLDEIEQLSSFSVLLDSQARVEQLRSAAEVDGVTKLDIKRGSLSLTADGTGEAEQDATTDAQSAEPTEASDAIESPAPEPIDDAEVAESPPEPLTEASISEPPADTSSHETQAATESPSSKLPAETPATPPAGSSPPSKTQETMRVDIDRLDHLMNLTGELVVNRARFTQILEGLDPAWRKSGFSSRMREFSQVLERTIETLRTNGSSHDTAVDLHQLMSGLALLNEQQTVWENGRKSFGQMREAMDQLARVSQNLQRGVLDTRMVPVGPLFNRFKRVIRDLSMDRGKAVHLQIRGEKTELDKRMIDELGDPIMHLIRNSVDHGLESPDVRRQEGKPEAGQITLEAEHKGNNVYIYVRDDGAGIDLERIRKRVVERDLLDEETASVLSDSEVLEYIWHAGFSTAKQLTDVSGRGVGMDVVRDRITSLNGVVDVVSVPGQGTTFEMRLPLTLAIIECLMIRFKNGVFSIPVEDVFETIALRPAEIETVRDARTFCLRGEYISLVGLDDIFYWHQLELQDEVPALQEDDDANAMMEVVIMQVGGRKLGLQVDDLVGRQDVVIKSLSENFVNIHGLAGASVLGDGSVCLMLDSAAMIDLALAPVPQQIRSRYRSQGN